MKHKQRIGLDKWRVEIDSKAFLKLCRQYDLELYDIQNLQGTIIFYTSILQRPLIYRAFPQAEHIMTTGMIGYLFRSMKKPSRVIGILLSCLLWYGLSHIVFAIEVRGEQEESRQLIYQTLEKMNYKPPFYQQDIQDIKMDLKKQLENEIAWLEMQKQGSRYIITYTPKEFASISELKQDELIAKEDGVIASFDIQHGNKVVKVNDFVHKGDVLVSNVLADSKGQLEEVYVKGRVYAYTWKDVIVTMDDDKMPKSFQYFQLLFEARREVSKDFLKEDTIYKENILQFEHDMGKIKMTLHYTLKKDITTP